MNRTYKDIKRDVLRLRKSGKTFLEIQKSVGIRIPKSTLSYWCKNIVLSKKQSNRIKKINLINLEKARRLAVAKNRENREKFLVNLVKKNIFLRKYLDKNVSKMLLSVLYLGEGSKNKSTKSLRLGSSSSVIIKLYLKLLKKCFEVDEKKFRVTILCRDDQDIIFLENFWQKVTKISKNKFYKARVDKRTEGKRTSKKDYRGVCVIDYFDTKIQLELETLAEQIESWL